MKYEYLLRTWGGFYNKENGFSEKYKPGLHYFDTEGARKAYVAELKFRNLAKGDLGLVCDLSEGFNCRTHTILHRAISYEGNRYYDTNDLGPNFNYSGAQYIMNYKWTLGCNHYPLGEDFDYENDKDIVIIQQWITGAFDIEQE